MLINICFGFIMLITSVLILIVAHDDCFPLYKRIPERALHGIVTFSRACLSSAVLIQPAEVKTPAGNAQGRSDFFPSTHWSVVVAAGESQAEPEIAQAALAQLCQTNWPPLYSFVRSRG